MSILPRIAVALIVCLLPWLALVATAQDDAGQKALDALNKALDPQKESGQAPGAPAKNKPALDALEKALDKPGTAANPSSTKSSPQRPQGKSKREIQLDQGKSVQIPVLLGPAKSFSAYKPELDHMFFFESGRDTPAKDQRTYQNSFVSATTRFINWELRFNFQNTFDASYTTKIKVVWTYPNGTTGEDSSELGISPEWKNVTWTWGRGWEQPTNWQKGTYGVDIYIEGSRVANGSFTVF